VDKQNDVILVGMQHVQTHSPLATHGFAHPRRNVGVLGVEPGMSVADFGSGSGAYVLAIAERLEGAGHVYAIDVQRDLLQRIKNEAHRRGFKNVEVIWADLERPGASKIVDRHLDFVLISNLLFQVENKVAVLVEAERILRPNGRLAIIDWSDPALSNESQRRVGPHRDHVISKSSVVELAESAGFELQREFPAGAHHYGLVFKLLS